MSQLDTVGLAKQTGFGSAASASTYFLDAESVSIDGVPDLIQPVSTIGYKWPQPTEAGTQVWKVGMDVLPRAASTPLIFDAFFGDPTTTTVDTTGKQHAFDVVAAAGAVDYMTGWFTRADPTTAIVDKISDMRGQTFTCSVTKGDFVKMNATFLGANRAAVSAPTPTLDATERFKWHQAKLYANIAGAGELELKVSDCTFTYDTQAEDDHMVLGSASLASIPIGTAPTATLDFTLEEEDGDHFKNWYDRAILSSSRPSIVYRLNISGSLVGAVTAKAGFEFKLWNAEVLNAPANIDAGSRMRNMQISNKCNIDLVNSKFVTVTGTNIVASY